MGHQICSFNVKNLIEWTLLTQYLMLIFFYAASNSSNQKINQNKTPHTPLSSPFDVERSVHTSRNCRITTARSLTETFIPLRFYIRTDRLHYLPTWKIKQLMLFTTRGQCACLCPSVWIITVCGRPVFFSWRLVFGMWKCFLRWMNLKNSLFSYMDVLSSLFNKITSVLN